MLIGGMHAMLIPEEVREHCDCIMIGDAEGRWAEMIADLKAGALKPEYVCEPQAIPQKGVLTRRDIFEGKGYLPITLLQFSRGCRYACSYCATSVYFGRRHHCRDVAEVVAEIRSQKRKYLFFVDDNITADREKAKELFRALIPLKVRWVSQSSLDMLQDPELMRLMVQSGCQGHVIGFESIREDSIQRMEKGVNRADVADHYRGAIQALRRYGLQTWAAFTVGHDTDTLDSIRETGRFAIRNKFTFAAYNILMPYPGTPLYAQLQAEGRLLYDGKWWLHPDYRFNHAAYVPAHMTPEQLTKAAFDCRRRMNAVGSILYRAFDFRTNMRNPFKLLQYAVYNPLFRKEVFKKQDMRFGDE